MRIVRAMIPAALLIVLTGVTACSQDATAPLSARAGTALPRQPSYDGGLTLGSGHKDGSDSTVTTNSPTSGQDEGGGLTLGSGH
jgi:hypothetical protein